MIKSWSKYNEEMGFFSKPIEKNPSKTQPRVMSSTGRPSEEEIERLSKNISSLKSPVEAKIDTEFLQEISDRLYGPDSEEYVKALKELNRNFRPRTGRYGSQFFDPSEPERSKKREQQIIQSMQKDK